MGLVAYCFILIFFKIDLCGFYVAIVISRESKRIVDFMVESLFYLNLTIKLNYLFETSSDPILR